MKLKLSTAVLPLAALLSACRAEYDVSETQNKQPPANTSPSETAKSATGQTKNSDSQPSQAATIAEGAGGAESKSDQKAEAPAYQKLDLAMPYERYETLIERKFLSRALNSRIGFSRLEITKHSLKKALGCVRSEFVKVGEGTPLSSIESWTVVDPENCYPELRSRYLGTQFFSKDVFGALEGCPAARAVLLPPMPAITADKIQSVRYGSIQLERDCSCTQTIYSGNPDGNLDVDAGWREIRSCSQHQLAEMLRATVLPTVETPVWGKDIIMGILDLADQWIEAEILDGRFKK